MTTPDDVPVARSPDGRLLLIKQEGEGGFALVLKPWPTCDREVARAQLRHSPLGLQWSPDGQAVGFLARHEGSLFRPWILMVGQKPVVLEQAPPTAFAVLAPAWHPDGSYFLYWAEGHLYAAGLGGVRRCFRGAAGQAGFAWSPDGQQVAAVGVLRPGHLQIVGPDGKRKALIAVCPGGKIRDVRWTRQGMLVTARTAGAEWYQVAKVDLGGAIEWLSEGPGDKRRPTEWADGRIVWESHRRGVSSIWSPLGQEHPGGASLPATGYQAKGWRLEFLSPSGVVAVDQKKGEARAEFPDRSKIEECRALAISVTGSDGLDLPAWLWQPKTVRGLVIDVHGAPRIAASPYRLPGIRCLLREGIAVLGINFRGSGGEGRTLEEQQGDPVEDLWAARQWAAQRYPGAPMVLHGHSFGAWLCLRSAMSDAAEKLAGLVLVSLRAPKGEPPLAARPDFPIAAFHGGWDLVAPVEETRAYLREIASEMCFTEFPEEGHAFHRRVNIVRSYERVVEIMKGSFTPRRNEATTAEEAR